MQIIKCDSDTVTVGPDIPCSDNSECKSFSFDTKYCDDHMPCKMSWDIYEALKRGAMAGPWNPIDGR